MNLAAVVRDNATRLPDKPAIVCGEDAISYGELWRRIESMAGQLAARGVSRGSRVGLSMRDHADHLIAHYAVARLSATILPIDHRWTTPEKQQAAEAFDAALVLVDDDPVPGVDSMAPDPAGDEASPGEIDASDSDLLISLSSGTTGRPKGALVTHRNLYERFKSQWQVIGYGEEDCFAVVTPLYFGAGRSFGMSMLAAGGTVLLAPPPLKPPELFNVLKQPEVTATFLPPTLLRRLLSLHAEGDEALLDNIRFLVVSGEPLFEDEARQCLQKICPNLYSYYASSEGGGISVLGPMEFAAHAATVGRPMRGTDVEIVDEDGVVLGTDEIGRLRYRGPGVATRYLDSDGAMQEAAVGGWFYPGDLAEMLPTGHVALRGRDKDVIIRAGVNVYPAEIERTLLRRAEVDDVAVVARDDSARGQVVVACVVGNDVVAGELRTYCEQNLAPYKVPEEFHLLAALPRAVSGKVDKKTLRELIDE